MNALFGGNGYRIIDQSSVPEEEITFKNAWGMCDENLYSQALQQADIDYAVERPFSFKLMTTSNHRPYTYPEGRIDIPSGYGREGAVKYTDYSIGEFMEQARRRPGLKRRFSSLSPTIRREAQARKTCRLPNIWFRC